MSIPPGAILVCGCQRSGTSLLTALLDGHSQILVFPVETFFFQGWRTYPGWTIEQWVEALLADPACRSVESFFPTGPDAAPGGPTFRPDLFARRFRELARAQGDVAQVLPALIAAYGLAYGRGPARYWAEKTPGNESSLFRAATRYRDLRPLYILRDPRAVLASLVVKQRREGRGAAEASLATFLFAWAQSLFAWERYVARGGRGLLMRYEDLVRDPRGTMARVCGFLEVPYEETLARPWLGGVPFSGNSSFVDFISGVSGASLERWRSVLSAAEIAAIDFWLGHVMQRHGYALDGPRARGWRSARAAVVRNPHRRYLLGLLLALGEPAALLGPVGDLLLRHLYSPSGDLVQRPEDRPRDDGSGDRYRPR